MDTVPIFYLDPDITGSSIKNKVVKERHVLPATALKIIAPNFGAFYNESIEVYSVSTTLNQVTKLIKNVDYYCTEVSDELTSKVGKEISFVILITLKTASTTIDVSYQAYGGDDNVNIPILKDTIAKLNIGSMPVDWTQLANKPKEFHSAHHHHDAADLYGLEYIVKEIKRVKTAVEQRDTAHDQINAELAVCYNTFLAILLSFTNAQIDAITVAVDACNAILDNANNKLVYAQKRYDIALIFYNAVNALYLSKQ